MKELTMFQCSVCNTVYNSKEKAEWCEKWHKKLTNIKSMEFKANGVDYCLGFPFRVVLADKNGNTAEYEYRKSM